MECSRDDPIAERCSVHISLSVEIGPDLSWVDCLGNEGHVAVKDKCIESRICWIPIGRLPCIDPPDGARSVLLDRRHRHIDQIHHFCHGIRLWLTAYSCVPVQYPLVFAETLCFLLGLECVKHLLERQHRLI